MSSLPIGSIIVWPTDDSPPSGWQVCDGTNGTPDLQGFFVPGAGDLLAVGDTGGSADFVVPDHTHELGDTTLAGGSAAIHDHLWDLSLFDSFGAGLAVPGAFAVETPDPHSHTLDHTDPSATSGGGDHGHDLSVNYNTGGVTGHNKLPLTIAYNFIQRLS